MGLLAKTGQGARRLLTWPFILVPWREILAGGRSIRSQANDLWSKVCAEDRQQVIRDGDRLVDLRGFAQAHGLSEQEGRALVGRRRRETAVAAYACFVLGWVTFSLVLYHIISLSWRSGPIVGALEFSPFCVLFFLMAFKFALDNFRLRVLRHATAGEFLTTNKPFWPH